MINQVVLVGRLTKDPIGIEINRNNSTISLAIPRSFKNAQGEYETDFIDCELWNTVASTTVEYCRKGDIVGVKGRLESRDNKLVMVAEKITFLSNHSGDN
jgi:single-strand DNA-binding protein